MPRRALYIALLIILAAGLTFAMVWYAESRPETYDNGTHEMVYSSRQGSFYLYISDDLTPETPLPEVRNRGEVGGLLPLSRRPVCQQRGGWSGSSGHLLGGR